MKTVSFSELTTTGGVLDLSFLRATLHPPRVEPWDELARASLTDDERAELASLHKRLAYYTTARVNEATLWARAIYPLLVIAEQGDVRAWSQVALNVLVRGAAFHGVEGGALRLQGVVDGALAIDAAGEPVAPFLLVMEAKRAVDASDPMPQLQGAMLATALQGDDPLSTPREVFGCFTIGDAWTFLLGRFERTKGEDDATEVVASFHPSREMSERNEAAVIAAILKSIVTRELRRRGDTAR